MKKRNADILGAGVVVAIGIFFLIQAQQVETHQPDLIGPSLVPSVIAGLVILLGLAKGVMAFACPRGGNGEELSPSQARAVYLKIAAITALGILYLNAFTWFGYLVSTLLILAAILFLFGNRGAFRIGAYAAAGAIAFYILFVGGMGIFDPPGTVINFQPVLPF